MWIRTQDKLSLTYNTTFRIGHLVEKDVETGKEEEFWVISCVDDLGKYKSRERALEVLDEIESKIMMNKVIEMYSNIGDMTQANRANYTYTPIYQMPEV